MESLLSLLFFLIEKRTPESFDYDPSSTEEEQISKTVNGKYAIHNKDAYVFNNQRSFI